MYYLKLKTGKSVTDPKTGVIITEGQPSEAQPVLFVDQQHNIRTSLGIKTSFYIKMFWRLDYKDIKLPFFVQQLTASESTVANFAQYQTDGSQIDLSVITEIQLYNYLLNIPETQQVLQDNGEIVDEPLLDQEGNPVMMFGDWELVGI